MDYSLLVSRFSPKGWHRLKLALVVGLLVTTQTRGFAQEPLRIAVGEWPPYTVQADADGGFALKVIREAFAIEGVEVEFEWLPWSRAMDSLIRGQRIASGPWIYTYKRSEKLSYSAPIMQQRSVLYALKARNFDWGRLEDLAGLRIGSVIGYSYGAPFELAEELGIIQVDPVSHDQLNLSKLLAGRVDLIVGDEINLNYLIQQLPLEERTQIVAHPKTLHTTNLHLLFNPTTQDHLQLLHRFNQGLAQLHSRGDLARWLPRGFMPVAEKPAPLPPIIDTQPSAPTPEQ